MRLAILGAGNIAGSMAKTVNAMEGVELYAIASRSIDKANAFRTKWNVAKAYGSYDEMLADDNVDLVYVATPHSEHYTWTKAALNHGRNVLTEKAFTVNANEAVELVALAKEKHKLLAEAIWTRYMPSRRIIDDAISRGVIGNVKSIIANLGYELSGKERLVRKKLAGGALLDLGVYTINFALMTAKSKVIRIAAEASLNEEGVDETNNITLFFENGITAFLQSTMLSRTNRAGLILGDKGYMEILNINNCEGIRVYNNDGVLTETIEVPKCITGYEYEIMACMKALESGDCECPDMPHAETIRVMEIMDGVSRQFEEKNKLVCPVCRRHYFTAANSYEICPVCKWENDALQSAEPDYVGGANNISLNEYRTKWRADNV